MREVAVAEAKGGVGHVFAHEVEDGSKAAIGVAGKKEVADDQAGLAGRELEVTGDDG
jgi:hypothetical protein